MRKRSGSLLQVSASSLLLVLFFLITSITNGQNIKMKIPSFTGLPADGEDLIAFEVSDTQRLSTGGGGGGSVGKTEFEFTKIKKQNSASTNELWKRSLNGQHTAEVQFEFYNASNVLFYKIVLKDVIVTHFSYLSPECTNCPRLFHQVWFDYGKIEVTDVATGNTVKFDRSANATY
jgi:type VI protein secretion system component Hcp